MIVEVILCFLLPPLAVAIHRGASAELVLNLILWLLFWIPGTIHALWVLFTMPPKRYHAAYTDKRKWAEVRNYDTGYIASTPTTTTTTTTYQTTYEVPAYDYAPNLDKHYSTYETVGAPLPGRSAF